MFWYILVVPALILVYDIVEPDKQWPTEVEERNRLYQHDDGRLYKSDWANNEDDL